MKKFGVVYLIVNIINGKKYVGQTTETVEKRFKEHARADTTIGKAIRKYGAENFRYGVIKTCATKAEMNYWETFFIAALKTKAPYGYNLTDGGDGTVGLKHTPEHNAKISAALTGKKRSPEHCANISAAKKGISLSPETIAKMIVAHRGKKRSQKARANISAALKGRQLSAKHRANLSVKKRVESPYKNLVAELDARQFSYAKLAKSLGLAASTVCDKMRGGGNLTKSQIAKLVEIFGKPIEYLLARDE